ncbi:invasion associated locus B family protein [Bartonella sp. A05]|uniref:invasion associated locus B family protein n=1 Tax=Bartonella sp. A05 TaxID=2967261 RepID=UPI0022A9029A|nr:invasion associated locus B family protein [Bartonella sp. A05]MCZ2203964.1 invasion associated locus B family protein [Bartonella sp. A05]
MMKNWNIFKYLLFTLVLLGKSEGLATEKDRDYTVHPPKLSVPGGEAGETRRVITQFHNWTLICDENRTLKQGICNVTQAIHDGDDNTIFSWSLVSTKNGQPVMLLRTLPDADTDVPIQVFVDGLKKPVLIRYTQCNHAVCLAQTPVGPIFSKQIEQNKNVRISYKIKEGEIFSFTTPFKGLNEALTSLQR